MRWRDTLISAGSLLLGCNSIMPVGDKQSPRIVKATEADLQTTKTEQPYSAEKPGNHAALPSETGVGSFLEMFAHKMPAEESNAEKGIIKSSDDFLDPLLIRLHHADLLVKHHRQAEAKTQYELSIREAEEMSPTPLRQLVHCHSKLMDLAISEEDDFAEHLHRGVGLYYLACQSDDVGGTAGKLNVESLLCQSAGELSLAKLQQPNEARPCWFLYQVWVKLDQKRPAARNLHDAEKTSSFSYLTPAERRLLYVAVTSKDSEPLPKR
jgi:hypothetical protein